MPPNPALNLAPSGRWTLRHKAAQRRLALRSASVQEPCEYRRKDSARTLGCFQSMPAPRVAALYAERLAFRTSQHGSSIAPPLFAAGLSRCLWQRTRCMCSFPSSQKSAPTPRRTHHSRGRCAIKLRIASEFKRWGSARAECRSSVLLRSSIVGMLTVLYHGAFASLVRSQCGNPGASGRKSSACVHPAQSTASSWRTPNPAFQRSLRR